MNKENSQGRTAYLRPEIETNDFMVESGIAASFSSGIGESTSIDYSVVGEWDEN